MIGFELLTGKTYWNADSLMAHLGQLLFSAMAPASSKAGELPAGLMRGLRARAAVRSADAIARWGSRSGSWPGCCRRGGREEPPSALVRAVEGRCRPGGPSGSDDDPGVRMGSAELSLRAEIFPGTRSSSRSGAGAGRRCAACCGGLGLSLIVLVLGFAWGAADERAEPSGAGWRRGMAGGLPPVAGRGGRCGDVPDPTAERSAAQPSPEPKPASTPTAKASTPSRPRERTAKSRRTYVPPASELRPQVGGDDGGRWRRR